MRNLNENSGTIAGCGIGTTGPTMLQFFEDFQSLNNDFMGLFTLHIHDKSHPTTVFFEGGIIKPLFFWKSGHIFLNLLNLKYLLTARNTENSKIFNAGTP